MALNGHQGSDPEQDVEIPAAPAAKILVSTG